MKPHIFRRDGEWVVARSRMLRWVFYSGYPSFGEAVKAARELWWEERD